MSKQQQSSGGGGGNSNTSTSNFVYIQSKEHSWIPARLDGQVNEKEAKVTIAKGEFKEDVVLELSKQQATKQMTISLKNYPNQTLPLQNVNEAGVLKQVEDMVDLSFLHEPAILYNLKARHFAGKPYTRTGDIVIAVNPYQWMMDLYSEERRQLYSEQLVFDKHKKTSFSSSVVVPPHVYESSALAYRGLALTGQDQSILVSGESGAGKTETVKICMNHLASIGNHYHSDVEEEEDLNHPSNNNNNNNSDVVQRVLDSNPLLEAFGNAQTVRNDNSSRFGKYLQLEFEVEDATHAAYAGRSLPSCQLQGSSCEVYLLEKSRVVSHSDQERGYHVFYQLLAASEEEKSKIWKGLDGTGQDDFLYVGHTDLNSIEGKTDAERFQLTRKALKLIGIDGDLFTHFYRVLCMVLQLGNLQFEVDEEEEEQSVISTQDELTRLADVMGVSTGIITNALTERTVRARNESFRVPLKPDAASDSRDALAKELYAKCFLWLVQKINAATTSETLTTTTTTMNHKKSSNSTTSIGKIGLLDIFGFESFVVNRFEQLCINYANEKLQQKFTQDIFQTVVAEYEAEGIPLGQVSYEDNAAVINLIEGRMGLIAILNEECVRPKGSDVSFVRKITALCAENTNTVLVDSKSLRDYEFGIHHYADKVIYDCTGFVQKNNDTLPADLLECAQQSSNPLLGKDTNDSIFAEAISSSSSTNNNNNKTAPPPPPPSRRLSSSKSTRLVHSTVWTKFKSQLTSLMTSLQQTRTRYIRCIKPNPEKLPRKMNHLSTMEQLRCAGVVAAVTISRSAFPNRLPHEEVYDRFGLLYPKCHDVGSSSSSSSSSDVSSAVNLLLTQVLTKSSSLQLQQQQSSSSSNNNNNKEDSLLFCIGKTRTYFRAGALEYLEAQRLECLTTKAVVIQRLVRKVLCLVFFRSLKKATIRSQAAWRGYRTYRTYRTIYYRILQVQCCVRIYQAKCRLEENRRQHAATRVQTLYRRVMAQQMLRHVLVAVIRMQSVIRGALQRPKYQLELQEAREEAKLENQLKTLQRKLEEAEARRIEAEQRAAATSATPVGAAAAAVVEPRIIYIEKEKSLAATDTDQERHDSVDDDIPTTIAAATTATSPMIVQVEERHQLPTLTSQQQQLMDESGKMLEYLRKEVFKLRTTNAQLRTDFDLLKENNQRLMDANASAGASFAALNQHAKSLNKKNTKLDGEVSHYKSLLQKSQLVQQELKEELKLKQQTYSLEVQSRLTYQKGMAQIVDLVGERCKDERLVEDVLQLSDDCDDVLHRNQAHVDGGRLNGGAGEDDDTLNNNNKRKTPSMMSRFTSFLF